MEIYTNIINLNSTFGLKSKPQELLVPFVG